MSVISLSGIASGAGAPWYLLDTSRAVKPLIWQEREDYDFQSITASNDPHVFFNDEYIYGVYGVYGVRTRVLGCGNLALAARTH